MSVNISAPNFLANFRADASKSFVEGTKNSEEAEVADWLNKNVDKLIESLETTEELSKLVVVASSPPQGCLDILNQICAPTKVTSTLRAGTNQYVVIFQFQPTFGTWRKGTPCPDLEKKFHPQLDEWETRLIERWSNPIMEALEKGVKFVIFIERPPEWIKILFEVPEFELKVEEVAALNKFKVTIVPKENPLAGLPTSYVSERTLAQLKEEAQ